MVKNAKPGFLKISVNHGTIFQKDNIERQWNCTPICNKENTAPEPKTEPEINKELIIKI